MPAFRLHTVLEMCVFADQAAGPQAFAERDKANGYMPAKIDMLVMTVASGVFIALVSFTHWCWNKQRDNNPQIYDQEEALRIALSDLTDKERPGYKYPY